MSTEPLFDPAAALPEAAPSGPPPSGVTGLAVRAVFADCREEYGPLVLSGQVVAVPGVEHLLRQVLAHHPGDPLATALLADRLIHVGWQARSTRRAQDVTPEGWREFRARLNEAEQLLIGAVARNRGDALAWMLRMTISRGISLGTSETRRRYRALTRVSPHHYAGQRSLLQQLLPKWGGSWEDAHAFARDCFRAAPPGSLNGALLAMYHAERAAPWNGPSGTRTPPAPTSATNSPRPPTAPCCTPTAGSGSAGSPPTAPSPCSPPSAATGPPPGRTSRPWARTAAPNRGSGSTTLRNAPSGNTATAPWEAEP
ncbi:hypothetical protein ACFQ1I_16140 [Kitasatospora arboriphila]